MLGELQTSPLSADIEAARARFLGRGNSAKEMVAISPVPREAGDPSSYLHHELRTPADRLFAYIDAEGRTVGYVGRWERTEAHPEKLVRPLSWCGTGTRCQWRLKGWPAPFPLFRLPELLSQPDATILVLEGEKKALAAQALFPDHAVVSPLGGASRAHQTDWSPVSGRRVIVAPDHDGASADFALKVCSLCKEAGASEILILPSEAMGKHVIRGGQRVERDAEIPKGWDLGDAADEGWTAEAVARHRGEIDAALRPFDLDRDVRLLAGEFLPKYDGLYRTVEDREGNLSTVWTSSPLELIALVRGPDGQNHGTLLHLTDADFCRHEIVVSSSALAGDGSEVLKILRHHGLRYDVSNRKVRDAILRYLSTVLPNERRLLASRVGWDGDQFILPHRVFGSGSDTSIWNGDEAHAFALSGTLEGWQEGAKLAVGNSRLAFVLCVALSAPLAHIVGSDGGGFHLRGQSSKGKSTLLRAAASVYGGPHYVGSWNTTASGLEVASSLYNDVLLILDEIGQAGRDVGAIAYELANGQGKRRATRTASARAVMRWRSTFLSSGEHSLADVMRAHGKGRKAAAGREVRIADIPAIVGHHGVYEHLHGLAHGGELSETLDRIFAIHHGHASAVLLDAVTRMDRDDLARQMIRFRDEFIAQTCPPDADGQVSRVAKRFGLAAATGELAIRLGILPWAENEAITAISVCFEGWLGARGGTGSLERMRARERFDEILSGSGTNRFPRMGEWPDAFGGCEYGFDTTLSSEKSYGGRLGFRRIENGRIEYVVPAAQWPELCDDLPTSLMIDVGLEAGILQPESGRGGRPVLRNGKPVPQQRVNLPEGLGRKRCYILVPQDDPDGPGHD